ncbi:MAG: hypothetical protein DSM106950_32110 [Stigonema ocellatum SAG 48.90 = DSM 106950]|nr:hypothetical protein [Stigonema ocellatum SAG 48.90 = DSM 106950]
MFRTYAKIVRNPDLWNRQDAKSAKNSWGAYLYKSTFYTNISISLISIPSTAPLDGNIKQQHPYLTPYPLEDYLSSPWRPWRLGGSLHKYSNSTRH